MDVEAFSGWLRRGGASDLEVTAARTYAIELGKHPSLSAALRDAQDRRVPAEDLAGLRKTAVQLKEFESGANRPELADQIDIVKEPPRPRRQTRISEAPVPRRQGCECKKREDVYLDNDMVLLGKLVGGGGFVGVILIRFAGILGALTIGLGLAGLGALGTMLSISIRCQGCRNSVHDLDEDERATRWKARLLALVVAVVLLGAAAACGYGWWAAFQYYAKSHYDYRLHTNG